MKVVHRTGAETALNVFGLTKFAVDTSEILQLLGKAKNVVREPGAVPSTMAPSNAAYKDFLVGLKRQRAIDRGFSPEEALTRAQAYGERIGDKARVGRLWSGQITMPTEGALSQATHDLRKYRRKSIRDLRDHAKYMTEVYPKGADVVDAATLQHELSERLISNRPKLRAPVNQHMSPAVLLREHNMIATLSGPGSRHARKYNINLADMMGEAGQLHEAMLATTGGRLGFKWGHGVVDMGSGKVIYKKVPKRLQQAVVDSLRAGKWA